MKPIAKSRYIFYQGWSKTRRCFINTTFHLCFRLCYYEGPSKPGGMEMNGTHQLLVYDSNVNLEKHEYYKVKYRSIISCY